MQISFLLEVENLGCSGSRIMPAKVEMRVLVMAFTACFSVLAGVATGKPQLCCCLRVQRFATRSPAQIARPPDSHTKEPGPEVVLRGRALVLHGL